jgi:histidine triad (HIT) family protein
MSECLFCGLIQKKANALFEDESLLAMLSPEPAVAGHVLVIPKAHSPILEAIPDFVVGNAFKIANKIGVAVFEALGAQGTNVLIQNGAPAGQRHNHAMLHVIPRFENDNLPIGWTPKPASDEELTSIESKLKDETRNIGIFEKEKPKPIEAEKPKELPKEDQRLKVFKRIP